MSELILVLICLTLNALLAAYEMAFVSIPRAELRALAKSGSKKASKLLNLRENPERTLSIIQIGITLVGAIAAAVGGAGAGENLEPYLVEKYQLSEGTAEGLSLLIVVIPITYLSVVIGELVPKTLALRNPTKIVLAGAQALFISDRLFSPLITLLEWSTQKILKIFFPRSQASSSSAEVPTIELNDFSPVHQKIIMNMADIEKKLLRDILLPWSQVTAVQKSASIDEVLQTVLNSGHTRLPVKENESVAGVLHTKEFISLKESGESQWLGIVRPTLFLKSTDSALGAMRVLQDKKTHMAIVASPTGQILGIVTLEDILEEVVGDIFDEDDDGRVRKVYAAKIKTRPVPTEKS